METRTGFGLSPLEPLTTTSSLRTTGLLLSGYRNVGLESESRVAWRRRTSQPAAISSRHHPSSTSTSTTTCHHPVPSRTARLCCLARTARSDRSLQPAWLDHLLQPLRTTINKHHCDTQTPRETSAISPSRREVTSEVPQYEAESLIQPR
jgi:hypothetical protein